jgi:glycosyltransferase involved in cell wall biosynthesis
MKKISICIHTYKRPEILADTLSHLASIRNMDMEVIISDNCSQDKTPDVVKTFEGKFESLRYYCQSENRGAKENSQTALSMASGQYAYILCDDDRVVPEGILAAIMLMDNNPEVVAIYGGYQEWDPKSNRILQDIFFVKEPQLYGSSDKLKIFNQFSVLWLPIIKTDIYQRFCFHEDNTFGHWGLVGNLMKHGKIAVIPDIIYKHAHTEPRAEYDMTEPWFHDQHRSDYEIFYGGMDEDMSDPKKPLEFMQFVGSRTVYAYLHGYRFACIKGEYLKQRHFLLRAKAYGLVKAEQLLEWEKGCLANASAERFKKILIKLPDVRAIVIEKTDVVRSFMFVMARMYSDIPKTIEVNRDEFIVRKNGTDEFLLSENYDTLACRINANSQVNRGFQCALYDLFSSLRITDAPLNINI